MNFISTLSKARLYPQPSTTITLLELAGEEMIGSRNVACKLLPNKQHLFSSKKQSI